MAVALNPTRTLYSSNSTTVENKKDTQSSLLNNNNNNNLYSSYADSPSRTRRSARVASLSPSKFTPLISNSTLESSLISIPSGMSSTSSSSNSFMPASPSRKYSLRGHRGEVSIDEITMNDIDMSETTSSTKNSLYPSLHDHLHNKSENYNNSNSRLRTNPERKHPTLDFQPTNLNTPSTTSSNISIMSTSTSNPPVNSYSSGITPSVKQINIQDTPSHKLLDSLVSKGDFEEIAKSTPLGGFYNRKSTVGNSEKEKDKETNTRNPSIQVETTKSRIQLIHSSKANNTNNTNNNTNNNNNNINNNNNNMTRSLITNNNANNTTPQKQIHQNHQPMENSDETIKVVRTLRNRSIIASPIPTASKRENISNFSKNTPNPNANNQQNTIFINFTEISTFFKKHQKNLLAYSLITLFVLATAYHIYEGLTTDYTGLENDKILNANVNVIESAITKNNLPINEVVVLSRPFLKEKSKLEEEFTPKIIELEEVKRIIEDKILEHQQKQKLQVNDNEREEIDVKLQNQRIEKLEKKLQDQEQQSISQNLDVNAERTVQAAVSELQSRALESVEVAVKGFEKRFQSLEEKILEGVKKMENLQNSYQHKENKSMTIDFTIGAKVIKSLTSRPIVSKIKANSAPENSLSASIHEAFVFPGNRGKLAIKLSHPLPKSSPVHVSLEHPMLPDRSCAPRDFEIWALNSVTLTERDNPVLLAKGTYNLAGPTLQTYQLNMEKAGLEVSVLQIRVRNNYGNDRFTCIHRLKIHD